MIITSSTTKYNRYRAYGNEHWTFDENGLMKTRNASINEVSIPSDKLYITEGKEIDRFEDGTYLPK